MKKAAIYVRVSTKDKGQDVTNQIDQLSEFCQRKDWDIVEIFKDNESGAKNNRSGLNAMFKAAYQKQFDVLLVWALDRLSREGMFQTINYLQKLDDYGVRFWSYTEEGVNTDNELVRNAMIAFMSSFAKIERQKISERTKAGLDRAKQNGKIFGPKPLWRREKYQGIDNKIDKMLAKGLTEYKIAEKLNISINTVKQYKREQDPKLKEKIIFLYIEKQQEREIAKELNISIRKVREVVLLEKKQGKL